MDYKTAAQYYEAITVIEAQGMLAGFKVSQFPWMKDKSKLHKEVHELAYPEQKEKTISFAEFAKRAKDGFRG